MSGSWTNSTKNVNVLAPVEVFQGARTAPVLPLEEDGLPCDHMPLIKKKNLCVQFVDAENYSKNKGFLWL